ncbi:MAG TPA: hypothetical protein VGD88_04845 [Opitutaceae bacterium]
MTTRRQIVLLVMPLFVGLAVLGGSLMAWLQLRTTERDFRTEVETAAIAISEFLPAEAPAPVTVEQAPAATPTDIYFERIRRWRQVERLFLIDASGQILADTLRGAPIDETLLAAVPPPDHPVVIGAVTPETSLRRIRPALVATRYPGVRLGIEVTAETFLQRRAAIRREVLIMSGVTLAVGFVVSLVLAAFVSWQFNRLSRLAGLVGDQAFERTGQEAAIQEVADVGSILGVMHSVLVETVDKTRRSLIDREYVRSDHALARVFRARTQTPATWSCGGATGIFVAVGAPLSLHGTLSLGPDEGAAFVGLLPFDAGLEDAVRSRAAAEYLTNALHSRPLASAAAATCDLFPLSELVVVRWSGDRLEEWHHRGAEPPFTTISTLSAVHPVVLSCIADDDRARLAVYLRTYPHASLERLAADLPAVLAGSRAGNVLALRRSST